MNTAVALTLGKLIPRLGSTSDGEVVATARAIGRTLKASGLDWHDLAGALALQGSATDNLSFADDWRRTLRYCADRIRQLSARDAEFISSLAALRRQPTPRQMDWLHDIARRLQREDAA